MFKKEYLPWIGFVAGMVALIGLLAYAGGGETSTATISQDIDVLEESRSKGPSDAKVTLVEYSDFQCPACASTYPMVKQVAADYPEDLRVIYRHFPLTSIHSQAIVSASASEAAANQGKFWEMHDMLFNTQAQWSGNSDAKSLFIEFAKSLGLDEEQFTTDLSSDETIKKVEDARIKANGVGLRGTPSFFLNGKQINHPGSYAGFKTIIEEAINS